MTQSPLPPRARTSSSIPKSGLPTFTSSIQSLSTGTYPYPSPARPTSSIDTNVGTGGSSNGSNPSAAIMVAGMGGFGAASWLGHGRNDDDVQEEEHSRKISEGNSMAQARLGGSTGMWDGVRLGGQHGPASPGESSLSASDYLGHNGSTFGTERWMEGESGPSSPTKRAEGGAGPRGLTHSVSLRSKAGSNSSIPEHITNFPLFAHHAVSYSESDCMLPPSQSPNPTIDSSAVEEGYAPDPIDPTQPRFTRRSDSFFSDPGPEEDRYQGLLTEFEIQAQMPTSISHLAPLQIGGSGPQVVPSAFSTSEEAGPSGSKPEQATAPFSPASAFLSSFSETHSVGVVDELVEELSLNDKMIPPISRHKASQSMSVGEGGGAGGILGADLSPPKINRATRRPSAPDAAGSKVLSYTLGKVIGRGGFSTVRMATDLRTGENFACRIVKRDDLSDISGSLENFEKELELWKALPRHPNILPLLEMYRDPRGYATYLISPFMAGGSLLDVLKRDRGSEKMARKWFPGIVAAVHALHEGYEGFEDGGMLHGDLKLDNILVGLEGEVCLADFGLAKKVGKVRKSGTPSMDDERRGRWSRTASREQTPQSSKSRSRTRPQLSSPFVSGSAAMPNSYQMPRRPDLGQHRKSQGESASSSGIHHHMPHPRRHGHGHMDGHLSPANAFPSASLPYAPPELLRAPPAIPSLAQDMWGLGIILYALLTSRLPFVDTFDPRLQMKIIRGDWAMPEGLGREWQECLIGLLDGNVETRWDVKQLMESDALIGWQEAKTRSKSRSRSRPRPPPREPSRERNGRTDKSVGRDDRQEHLPHHSQQHHTHVPNRLPHHLAAPPASRSSSYHDITMPDHLDRLPEDSEPPVFHRNQSATGDTSRSRSSGRDVNCGGMFMLDQDTGMMGVGEGGMSVPGPRSGSRTGSRSVSGRSRSRSRARQNGRME